MGQILKFVYLDLVVIYFCLSVIFGKENKSLWKIEILKLCLVVQNVKIMKTDILVGGGCTFILNTGLLY